MKNYVEKMGELSALPLPNVWGLWCIGRSSKVCSSSIVMTILGQWNSLIEDGDILGFIEPVKGRVQVGKGTESTSVQKLIFL